MRHNDNSLRLVNIYSCHLVAVFRSVFTCVTQQPNKQ